MAEIEKQLNTLTPTRDRLELKWDRAMANANQLEMLNVRDPADRHLHNSAVNWAAAGGAFIVDLAAMGIIGTPVGATGAMAGIREMPELVSLLYAPRLFR